MWQFTLTLVVTLMFWVPPADAAGSIRCGSRIVQEGQRAAELLAICGEPSYRDVWGYGGPRGGLSDVEEWYYNLGPSQLLRIVRLRNGRIVTIDTDGYGYHEDSVWRCSSSNLTIGLSKFRLLRQCGEPLTRRSMNVLRPVDRDRVQLPPGYGQAMTPVHREEWVYNFGAHQLLRIVTLEDGRVVDVQSGERGFHPR